MKKYLLALVFLAIILTITWVFVHPQKFVVSPPPQDMVTTTPSQVATTTQTDPHLSIDGALRDVNFCDHIYKVKQIKIDGVDVVQRIAELVNSDQIDVNKKDTCNRLASSRMYGGLKDGDEIEVGVDASGIATNSRYKMAISFDLKSQSTIGDFEINFLTDDIFVVIQKIDGYINESFGKLK